MECRTRIPSNQTTFMRCTDFVASKLGYYNRDRGLLGETTGSQAFFRPVALKQQDDKKRRQKKKKGEPRIRWVMERGGAERIEVQHTNKWGCG